MIVTSNVNYVKGTTNQVNVDKNTGSVTFSTPQDIATTSDVEFNSLTTGYIDFDTAYAGTMQEGRMAWDTDEGTVQVGMPGGVVNLQLGQEQLLRVTNGSGSDMTNGQLVYISGATGNRPTIALAQADSEATADQTIGILTENIANNQQGYINTFGLVREVDTSLYAAGTALYLSATTAGAFVGTAPAKPNHQVRIGYVLRQHATEGVILFELRIGGDLEHLHDVSLSSLANGDILEYNSSSSLWINTPNTALQPGDNVSELVNDAGYLTATEQNFVSQTSVTVTHNLGRMVHVSISDASRNRIIPNNIQDAADYNSVTITFSSAESGRILVS